MDVIYLKKKLSILLFFFQCILKSNYFKTLYDFTNMDFVFISSPFNIVVKGCAFGKELKIAV